MKKTLFLALFVLGTTTVLMAQSQKSNSIISVADCQGHTYPVVKIGDQYWMAENLQCTRYDTQSERAGMFLEKSIKSKFEPYYTDGRNAGMLSGNKITKEQRKHLGLLYNWAAVMGNTESQAIGQKGDCSGKCQGICPNGWHVPNVMEWNDMLTYCGGTVNGSANLKSREGWYDGGNGIDIYGFCGLPAGCAIGGKILEIGVDTYWWVNGSYSNNDAYVIFMHYSDNDKLYLNYSEKSNALSVRCVKD